MEIKPKLLITASTFPRYAADAEPRFILDLAKSLLPFFEVTVLAPSAPNASKQEVLEGVSVIRYRYFPIKKLETLCYPGAIIPRIKQKKIRGLLVPFLLCSFSVKLWKIHKNYDIIHAHWLIPQGIVQSFFRTPYIVTGHGGDVTGLNNGIIRKLKRRALKNAAAVTAVSSYLAEKMQNLYPGKNPAIISMGCNAEQFNPSYHRDDYFGQRGKPVILFVGRLVEKKGLTYLIDAMKEIDAMLVVVGTGPLEESLKEQAKIINEKIIFMGGKTHQELSVIYASADIFCLPSVTAVNGDQEGMPTVLAEAMASGLPVVASRSSGIPDIVQHGVNGYLVTPGRVEELADSINNLLDQPDLRASFQLSALETSKRFSYDSLGKEFAKILIKAGQKGDKNGKTFN